MRTVNDGVPKGGLTATPCHCSCDTDGWLEKFTKVTVRSGRPATVRAKVSTMIRLSHEVIDHFRAGGCGWQTRIDHAPRDWIKQNDVT